jgi:MED6 mediator sub complex component
MRMQTNHVDSNYRMSRAEMETELKYAISVSIGFYSQPSRRFTGLEYALVHAQPPLFVIQRRDRLSPTEG